MLQKENVRDELEKIAETLKKKEALFEFAEDGDLIEALIYEQKALNARYSYLIKKAKEEKIRL